MRPTSNSGTNAGPVQFHRREHLEKPPAGAINGRNSRFITGMSPDLGLIGIGGPKCSIWAASLKQSRNAVKQSRNAVHPGPKRRPSVAHPSSTGKDHLTAACNVLGSHWVLDEVAG